MILEHPLLKEAWQDVTLEAMRALAEVEAANQSEIQRLQAIITAVDAVQAQLYSRILVARDSGGVSMTEPMGQPLGNEVK